MTDRGPVKQATPARQGQTGTGARWVLRIALVLVVVAFAVIFISFMHRGSGQGGQNLADQRVPTTPNAVRETAANAAPGSVPAQAAGRQEQTTGG